MDNTTARVPDPTVAGATPQDHAPADREQIAQRLAQHREQVAAVVSELRAVEGELEALQPQRQQHGLLFEACHSLQKLDEVGGSPLFWGQAASSSEIDEHLRRARERIEAFRQRIRKIEQQRDGLVDRLKQHQAHADLVEDELFEALEEEERRQQEWIIERAISELPARKLVLPWNRSGEDDKRFRKTLGTALLLCLLLAAIFPLIELPQLAPAAPDVPQRVVELLMQPRPEPPPPPVAPQEQIKPPPPEQRVAEQKPVPQRAAPEKETPQPAQAVEQQPEEPRQQGILAFREKFAGVDQDQVVARLGSQAHINDVNDSLGRPERAMLTTNAPGSSGGINLAALSRGVGGSGNAGMARVQVTRATSAIGGIGTPGGPRPLGSAAGEGVGMSRTDEEIQIVFDRYKAALYRLYNRELRKDPTLRGQMVLRLTIEADGSVSLCELHGSDMNAPELSAQVVDRVRTINFGAKEGISAITILYPIDFLPAA